MHNNNLYNIQLNKNGDLRHFLSIQGLDKDLILSILDRADTFIDTNDGGIRKVPLLRGKTVMNLFFEPSTRTLTTFELAAKRLSADVLNLNINRSSTTKGESLKDTLLTLDAMSADIFVVRHNHSGAAHFIAEQIPAGVAIINGGDGSHSHPTQAMLDMLTIRKHARPFHELSVAIVGDILHSRVARSQIQALRLLGVPDIRVIAPKTLLPTQVEMLGVDVFDDLESGLSDVDVVIMLRLQKERMRSARLPSEREYFRVYGLTERRLKFAKPDAIVMHPGPINRGVEIESSIADGPQSMILKQVSYGLAIRMAVLSMAVSGQTLAATE